MPIYQYKCSDKECEVVTEVIQKLSEDPLTKCPFCEKETLEKQMCARTIIKMRGIKG